MIDLTRVAGERLQTEPYRWASIGNLFSPDDAAALATTFPDDHFTRRSGDDGEKAFEYDIRCLIRMGDQSASRLKRLSGAWQTLANDLLAPAYRSAMASLTGLDLSETPLEVNVFRYPPGGSHGAHPDHRRKIVTHILYFNETWNDADGGCLLILRSRDIADAAAKVSPLAGNSAVVVRSDHSWHAVSRVADHCVLSRRCLTATFYEKGTESTVWPRRSTRIWQRFRRAIRRAE